MVMLYKIWYTMVALDETTCVMKSSPATCGFWDQLSPQLHINILMSTVVLVVAGICIADLLICICSV